MSESWMEEVEPETDPKIMVKLQQASEKLRQLEYEMMVAEDAYNQAKAAFTAYATKELPEAYLAYGIQSMSLADGTVINIKRHTTASIKKGQEQSVVDFLRVHQGEHLIKGELAVSVNDLSALKRAGIPFEEKTTVNTNSLKAFVLDEMGQGRINEGDLPSGLRWYQWDQAEVVTH